MKRILVISIAIFFLIACNNTKETSDKDTNEPYKVEYAKGFEIRKYTEYTEVTVSDPWSPTQFLEKYILVNKNKKLPENLPQGILIRTPLENVVVYSTIHCTVLNELGLIDIVKGVCEPNFIDNRYITEGIKNGSIADLGLASSPNIEKIIETDPEAIMATPIQGITYGSIEKTKIPMIETPDYMESTPLGRAEWIKFYSVFTGKEQLADSLFRNIVDKYKEIKKTVENTTNKPTVFTDTKYGNVWYTPGGKSYVANMLHDAGANYIWNDDNTTGSIPLPFEAVLDKAGDAKFWLIKYNQPTTDMTYEQLENEFKPYSYFEAFKNKNIYGCNTHKAPYYEDIPVHPEYILQELAYIFHPNLFPDYTPKYYKKLIE